MRTDSQNEARATKRILAVLVALVVGLAGSAGAQAGRQPLDVVVTLQPWASLTSVIGGEHATVTTLLPAGASPHAFDPLPSQAVALARADLVLMNGGLDDWLVRLLEATATSARHLTLLTAIEFTGIEGAHDHGHDGDDHHSGDDEDEHDGEALNPHVWLDPVLAAEAVGPIADALAEIDPEHAEEFRSNAAGLHSDLLRLDEELRSTLQPVAGAPIVPFHDAWVYFARRYDLDIVATLEPFPGREPSAAYLAATVAQIRSSGVRVIFTERQLNDRTAEVVAESAGVELAVLDPIGGVPGPNDYFDLLRWNATIIVEALGSE